MNWIFNASQLYFWRKPSWIIDADGCNSVYKFTLLMNYIKFNVWETWEVGYIKVDEQSVINI